MASFSVKELVTPAQAAKIMRREVNGVLQTGVTRQWVFDLMNRGRIPVVVIAGKRFLRKQDVLDYRGVPGRPKTANRKRGRRGLAGSAVTQDSGNHQSPAKQVKQKQ